MVMSSLPVISPGRPDNGRFAALGTRTSNGAESILHFYDLLGSEEGSDVYQMPADRYSYPNSLSSLMRWDEDELLAADFRNGMKVIALDPGTGKERDVGVTIDATSRDVQTVKAINHRAGITVAQVQWWEGKNVPPDQRRGHYGVDIYGPDGALRTTVEWATRPALSPDGTRLLVIDQRAGVQNIYNAKIINPSDGSTLADLGRVAGETEGLEPWARNGGNLALPMSGLDSTGKPRSDQTDLVLYDPRGTKTIVDSINTHDLGGGNFSYAWSGDHLVYQAEGRDDASGTIYVYSPLVGERVKSSFSDGSGRKLYLQGTGIRTYRTYLPLVSKP